MVIVWCSVALVNGRGLFSVSLQSNLKSERQKINNLILLSAHTLYTGTGSSYVGQKKIEIHCNVTSDAMITNGCRVITKNSSIFSEPSQLTSNIRVSWWLF